MHKLKFTKCIPAQGAQGKLFCLFNLKFNVASELDVSSGLLKIKEVEKS